jgi:hypothetical protein
VKKKIITTLSATALLVGLGVVGATSANGATRAGPYASRAICIQVENQYEQYGHKDIMKPAGKSDGCYKPDGDKPGWYFVYFG